MRHECIHSLPCKLKGCLNHFAQVSSPPIQHCQCQLGCMRERLHARRWIYLANCNELSALTLSRNSLLVVHALFVPCYQISRPIEAAHRAVTQSTVMACPSVPGSRLWPTFEANI